MVEDGVGDPTRVEVYAWTPKGEMAGVSVDEDGDGGFEWHVLYGYDDRGTLVERTAWATGHDEEAVTERYLVDYENPTGYSQVVAEWRAEGDGPFQIARLYTYADDLRAESTLIENVGAGAGGGGPGGPAFAHVPGVQFPLRDALGTVRASVQGANALTGTEPGVTQYQYSAFGSPLDSALVASDSVTRGSLTSQSAPSPWAFTGQRIDPATGLQYHRARWLDMALGRWASVDPVWDWPGNVGAELQYIVVETLSAVDPLGTNSLKELLVVVSIITSIIGIVGLPALKAFHQTGSFRQAGLAAGQATADFFLGLFALVKNGLRAKFTFDFMYEFQLYRALVSGIISELGEIGELLGEFVYKKQWGMALLLCMVAIASVGPSPDDFTRGVAKSAARQMAEEAAEKGAETVARNIRRIEQDWSGLESLSEFRQELGLKDVAAEAKVAESYRARGKTPPAGTVNTLARLEINGEVIYGINGHRMGLVNGQYESFFTDILLYSRSHAEIDVFNQAVFRDHFGVDTAVLYVDRPLCRQCTYSLGKVVDDMDLGELRVITPEWPEGRTVTKEGWIDPE